VPMHLIKEKHGPALKWCHEARSTRWPADDGHRAAMTTSTSAIGAAMIGWFGTAMLCYVTPGNTSACRQDDVKEGIITYKIAAARRRTWPRGIPARRSRQRLSKRASNSAGRPVQSRPRPGQGGGEIPRRDIAQGNPPRARISARCAARISAR